VLNFWATVETLTAQLQRWAVTQYVRYGGYLTLSQTQNSTRQTHRSSTAFYTTRIKQHLILLKCLISDSQSSRSRYRLPSWI